MADSTSFLCVFILISFTSHCVIVQALDNGCRLLFPPITPTERNNEMTISETNNLNCHMFNTISLLLDQAGVFTPSPLSCYNLIHMSRKIHTVDSIADQRDITFSFTIKEYLPTPLQNEDPIGQVTSSKFKNVSETIEKVKCQRYERVRNKMSDSISLKEAEKSEAASSKNISTALYDNRKGDEDEGGNKGTCTCTCIHMFQFHNHT